MNLESGTAGRAREVLEANDAFEVHAVAPDAIAATVRDLVKRGATRVLVAGGDGTIATAAAVLIDTPVELALLPGGTLNHFARDLGIDDDPAEALRIASGASVRTVDVGVVNGRVFLNTSSVGAYVRFVRVREMLESRFGYRAASFLAALRNLFQLRLIGVQVDVEGKKRIYRSPLVFVGVGERELKVPGLGNRVQGGKRGFHVMVVQGRPSARVFALAFAAVSRGVNRVAHSAKFDSFVADGFRLDVRRTGQVAIDGELVTLRPPFSYELKRDALRVVCPPADVAPGEATKERREGPREGAPSRT